MRAEPRDPAYCAVANSQELPAAPEVDWARNFVRGRPGEMGVGPKVQEPLLAACSRRPKWQVAKNLVGCQGLAHGDWKFQKAAWGPYQDAVVRRPSSDDVVTSSSTDALNEGSFSRLE